MGKGKKGLRDNSSRIIGRAFDKSDLKVEKKKLNLQFLILEDQANDILLTEIAN